MTDEAVKDMPDQEEEEDADEEDLIPEKDQVMVQDGETTGFDFTPPKADAAILPPEQPPQACK